MKNNERFDAPSVSGEDEPLIPSQPHLRDMYRLLTLLESEEVPGDGAMNWKNLAEQVKPYHTMSEFSDNVREAVRDYISKKIPLLQERVPRLQDLDEQGLLNALTNNWFEEIPEAQGQRREVLLLVAAHIVKRVEIFTEKKLFQAASAEQLAELRLDASLRDLTVDLLDVAAKVDPLFVRFVAYSQIAGEPPEGERPQTSLLLPGDPKEYALTELFPRESRVIANRLRSISETYPAWQDHPGAAEFLDYVKALSQFYESANADEASERHDEVMECYAKVSATEFPLILTPGNTEYYQPPYFDPEMKVSFLASELKDEEEVFKHGRDLLAKNLNVVHLEEFADEVRAMGVRIAIVLGGFGSNLHQAAVSQENPIYILYLNEQQRTYDVRFPSFLNLIEGSDKAFASIPEAEKKEYLDLISHMTSMLHEFGHPVYSSELDEVSARLGDGESAEIIDEVKAETLWRPLVPAMLQDGFLGTPEQWACAMLANEAMLVKDEQEGSGLFAAAVYNLNNLFAQGVVALKQKKLVIADIDAFYATAEKSALEVLALYQDPAMTEARVEAWIERRCTPSPTVQKFISFAKGL